MEDEELTIIRLQRRIGAQGADATRVGKTGVGGLHCRCGKGGVVVRAGEMRGAARVR